MKLSVIIPAYNEKNTIEEVIRRVERVDIPKEIIVVDDGSTDGTREILERLDGNLIKLIKHPHNTGKGSAIKTAIKEVTGDMVIVQDADLEYDPGDYIALVEPIKKGEAEVVYGYRCFQNIPIYSNILFILGGFVVTWFANLLYNANIKDEPTCYKVFKTEILKGLNLRCKSFEFCPEVTAKIIKKGIKIHEVPVKYFPRSVKEGKKIRWKDGIRALWALLKYRIID